LRCLLVDVGHLVAGALLIGHLKFAAPILDDGQLWGWRNSLDDAVLGAGGALFDVAGEKVARGDHAVEQTTTLDRGAERPKHLR
jgi:hypothetical protein